jgi:hypothetical protein
MRKDNERVWSRDIRNCNSSVQHLGSCRLRELRSWYILLVLDVVGCFEGPVHLLRHRR